MLALVIPIEAPVRPDQGLPSQPPQAGNLPSQPGTKPPTAGNLPSGGSGGRPSNPIYFPPNPEQGLPGRILFPQHPISPGGETPGQLPSGSRPAHPDQGPAGRPPRPDQGPAGRPPQAGNELPSNGIPIIGPPIYVEGNPPMIGWELPEQPTNKPTPTPPAQPKK